MSSGEDPLTSRWSFGESLLYLLKLRVGSIGPVHHDEAEDVELQLLLQCPAVNCVFGKRCRQLPMNILAEDPVNLHKTTEGVQLYFRAFNIRSDQMVV